MGAPSAVVFGLVLVLAVVVATTFGATRPTAVPDELLNSQQRLADNVARSVGISARQSLTDLRTAGELATGEPAQLANAVLGSHPRWRGTALVDASTRAVLAQQGEAVPVDILPSGADGTVQFLPRPGTGLRLLVAVRLTGIGQEGKLVAAVSGAELPAVPIDAAIRQGVLLTGSDNQFIDFQGGPPVARDPATRALMDRAARAAASGQTGSVVGRLGGGAPAPTPDLTAVVAYAPVAVEGVPQARGLAVLSVVNVPVTGNEAAGRAMLPTVSLLVLALLGFLIIQFAITSPVHRLRESLLNVASGQFRPRAGRFHVIEAQRIAATVEHCRSTLRGDRPTVTRSRFIVPVDVAVGVAVVGLLGWSAVIAGTLGRDDAAVPSSLVASSRSVLGTTTDGLRRTLNDGLADLRTIAGLSQGAQLSAMQPALERFASRQSRYRSVYIVDSTGAVVASAGRAPLRPRATPPAGDGIAQQNTQGRVPVLFGHTPLPGNRHALIGELDIAHLSSLLARTPGRVRVVDPELRTLAANRGFVAFEKLGDAELQRRVAEARTGPLVAAVADLDGRRSLLAVGVIAAPEKAAGPGWVVVADQPVSDLALTDNELRRDALMLSLVGAVLAVMLFGWQHLLVSRPLRRVANAADQLRAGDTRTVLFPQRQDEIGTIACCLEICRQALVDGVGRLGEVRRDPSPRRFETASSARHGRS